MQNLNIFVQNRVNIIIIQIYESPNIIKCSTIRPAIVFISKCQSTEYSISFVEITAETQEKHIIFHGNTGKENLFYLPQFRQRTIFIFLTFPVLDSDLLFYSEIALHVLISTQVPFLILFYGR